MTDKVIYIAKVYGSDWFISSAKVESETAKTYKLDNHSGRVIMSVSGVNVQPNTSCFLPRVMNKEDNACCDSLEAALAYCNEMVNKNCEVLRSRLAIAETSLLKVQSAIAFGIQTIA